MPRAAHTTLKTSADNEAQFIPIGMLEISTLRVLTVGERWKKIELYTIIRELNSRKKQQHQHWR